MKISMRILLVDDEPVLLEILEEYLRARGFDCDSAQEVAEAQAMLGHIRFDIVVTDIFLSPLHEADGLRVLSFIRERGLPVRTVVMTAHATPELVTEACRLGADAVLHKPTSLAILAHALTDIAEACSRDA
jgi:DNA-binding response OmpR family regulator